MCNLGLSPYRFLRILMIWVFSLMASACAIDRSGFGRAPDPVQWDVVPPYFCPGDPVTVSWDFSPMRRDHRNCRPPNGGFGSLTTCVFSRDCPMAPEGAVCFDGYCCRRDLRETPGALMCDNGSGCYPAFDITIRADTLTLDPPVDHEHAYVRGTRTVAPADTTTFTIAGNYSPPGYLFESEKTSRMVRPEPPTPVTLSFLFGCTGATPGWRQYDFNSKPLATEHVRITRVRNSSGHTIVVQRTGREPQTLAPGEFTNLLNGNVDGVWSAGLSPLDPGFLSRPRCGPTEVSDPWPDLFIELLLICVAG